MVRAPEIWVLQHPQERHHSKGTLRIAQGCLPQMRVLVGEHLDDFAPLSQLARPDDTALVFPTPHSVALEPAPPGAIRRWVIIDGTWRKARKILHCNPWLQALPCVHFAQPPESRYHIRKRPGPQALSTVESIAWLIRHAAPCCDVTPLYRGLEVLIDRRRAAIPENRKNA